jgi:4-hydroxybenzoate polyprenyltransferase
MGRASAAAPIIAILGATIFRMILEGGMYSRWSIDFYPRIAAQQLTFYTFMFVSFAVILKYGLKRPFERVTNVASVGLVFSVMPPVLHAYFFEADERLTVYFKSFTWTLFERDQAAAESVVLWALIASTGLFVALMRRSLLRGLLATAAAYGVIQLLSLGVLEALQVQDMANSNLFFGFAIGTGEHFILWVSFAQALAAFLLYTAMKWRTLWPSFKRLNHAFPHVALIVCGAAWVGGLGWHLLFYGALTLLTFFALLVQNDYFDRKEDKLAGRSSSVSRDEVLWVTFFVTTLCVAWFFVFPWMVMLLVAILILGVLYHHPSVRLKTRFCLSYMVEGGWAALAFAIGTAGNEGPVYDAQLSGITSWIFWGGALLSMIKDWKDFEADQAAGIWTMYVTLTKKWSLERVHHFIVASITLGLVGFAVYNGTHGGVVGAAVTIAAAAFFIWVALNWRDRGQTVEASMYAYTVALIGVAVSFIEIGAPGIQG